MVTKTKKAPATEPAVDDGKTLAHDPSSNQPPPDADLALKLEELEMEAANWLDDEPLTSQKQADELTKLVDAAARLSGEVEQNRKAEKEPHLLAGREVDAKYKPLQERADKALRKLKNKVGEWLKAVRADKERREREAAEEARQAAERLRQEHERNRQSSDLADDAALAEAEEAAKQARIDAAMVKKETVTAKAGGTTVKLRTLWLVNVVERRELLMHYLRADRADFKDELTTLLRKFAERDVRTGARSLPGCSIWSEERPV